MIEYSGIITVIINIQSRKTRFVAILMSLQLSTIFILVIP